MLDRETELNVVVEDIMKRDLNGTKSSTGENGHSSSYSGTERMLQMPQRRVRFTWKRALGIGKSPRKNANFSLSEYSPSESSGNGGSGNMPRAPAGAEDDGSSQNDPKKLDMLLLMAKCSVPALFVLVSAIIAIPLNENGLSDFAREATEEFAGGALVVTYAFELTKGYRLKDEAGDYDKRLILWTFLGTVVSAQIQTFAQGMWPYEMISGDTVRWVPDENCTEWQPVTHANCTLLPVLDTIQFGDAVPFAIAFFVDGVVLGYDAEPMDINIPAYLPPTQRMWRRIKPAFSVLTLVVSIDNAVDGIGMYQRLDKDTMPTWMYYALFIAAIYAGGIVTASIRKIPHEGVQAAWFAFGALSILVGGMELAMNGFTTWVLFGFIFVWLILLCG